MKLVTLNLVLLRAAVTFSFEITALSLSVTVAGREETKVADNLPFAGDRFSVLTGIFILAALDPADTHPVFYVDNVKLTHEAGKR